MMSRFAYGKAARMKRKQARKGSATPKRKARRRRAPAEASPPPAWPGKSDPTSLQTALALANHVLLEYRKAERRRDPDPMRDAPTQAVLRFLEAWGLTFQRSDLEDGTVLVGGTERPLELSDLGPD